MSGDSGADNQSGSVRDWLVGKPQIRKICFLKVPGGQHVELSRLVLTETEDIPVERDVGSRAELELGVCGEHGADPVSIDFFAGIGVDYVSCSPFRVPVARLAAAQSVLRATPPT